MGGQLSHQSGVPRSLEGLSDAWITQAWQRGGVPRKRWERGGGNHPPASSPSLAVGSSWPLMTWWSVHRHQSELRTSSWWREAPPSCSGFLHFAREEGCGATAGSTPSLLVSNCVPSLAVI